MSDQFVLKLKTDLNPAELKAKLDAWAPWGHRIDFDNGVSTRDCQRRRPFSENCLQKLELVSNEIPFGDLRDGRVLDVGCNSGYNSIACAVNYGMSAVGIDVTRRHVEVSSFLAQLAGATETSFRLADAETFEGEDPFDVVLHFGTLYHLPNPMRSLKTSYENLRPGGWLALETQLFDHPDDPNICYFMNMLNDDPTNFWALSTKALNDILHLTGFAESKEVLRVVPAGLEPAGMSRAIFVARRPNDVPREAVSPVS